MKKHDVNKDAKSKQPFFARYLEGQQLEQASGGAAPQKPPYVTLKWPSDDDEYPTW